MKRLYPTNYFLLEHSQQISMRKIIHLVLIYLLINLTLILSLLISQLITKANQNHLPKKHYIYILEILIILIEKILYWI